MGKILMSGTSGGVASDDITAKREDIIAGKTAITADSDDEIVEGTLPEHTADVAATSSGLYGSNYQLQFPKGAYRRTDLSYDISGGRVTVGLPTLRSNIGYTNPAKVLNDTTIAGQTGTIPIQGGSTIVPGTANKTAIGGGRYASANIIVSGDPNLIAANIKKGARIFGVTGTHDGFVPGPMDIYNRGTWGAGYGTASVAPTNTRGKVYFNSNHILNQHRDSSGLADGFTVLISNQGKPFNLQPYNTVNIVYSNQFTNNYSLIRLRLLSVSSIETVANTSYTTERTISLNISSFNGESIINFFSDSSNATGNLFIYRIYFT